MTAETLVRETSFSFDMETLTLGELAAVERASGLSATVLMKGAVSKMLVALYVHRLRNSDEPPSWRELESLRVLDAPSLI